MRNYLLQSQQDMSTAKLAFKNISYLLLARLTFRFLTAFALIYAARYLGSDRYGMYSTATAWANAFLVLSDVGLSTVMLRVAAREPEKIAVYFGNTMIVQSVMSLFIWLTIVLIGIGIGYNTTTLYLIMILGASNLIFESRKVMRGVFRVNLSLKRIGVLEVFNGAAFFGISMLIMLTGTNKNTALFGLAHTSLWVDLITVVLLFLYTVRLVRPHVDLSLIKGMIKDSWIFTLYNMFLMLYFQIDQIILSILKDNQEVGLYSAPMQIVTVVLFIPIMVFQVTVPLMFRFSKNNMEKYKRANTLIWRYLSAIGIPIGVGFLMLASEILNTVYGMNYFDNSTELFNVSVLVAQLFGLFLIVRFCTISQGSSITTTDRQHLRAILQVIAVAVNIGLDILFIPKYGAVGAASATLFTEAVIGISSVVISARYLKESLFSQLFGLLPVVGATAGMAGAIFLAKPHLHVMVLVILGAVVYAPLLWLFRFFTPQDRELIQQILNKKTAS